MVAQKTALRFLPNYHRLHHNGRRFRNIWGPHPDSDTSRFDPMSGDIRHNPVDVASWLLRKGLGVTKTGLPAEVRPVSREEWLALDSRPRAYWLGHASCLLMAAGVNVLTDPVFGERVSPVRFAGPRRLCGWAAPVSDLPRVDAIILSHNHYDHAEVETLRFLAYRDSPPIFVPLRVAPLVRRLGFRTIYELDWWQQVELPELTVTCLPCKHFSGRTATDRNETLWASFMVDFHRAGRRVYFAGDTAYSPHFSEIAAEFPDIDLALIPVGAYLPRWFMREVHVSPEEAITAFLDLRAQAMLGIHWGTYDLADEDYDQPKREALAAAARLGVEQSRLWLPAIGQCLYF
ncbi:MAG: MBL fold metallo-hydrolase [Turneriella sp.]|nr:MBL fold metallo-hydrolase [Turneriella sp.]